MIKYFAVIVINKGEMNEQNTNVWAFFKTIENLKVALFHQLTILTITPIVITTDDDSIDVEIRIKFF